jgi:hypothetical protein
MPSFRGFTPAMSAATFTRLACQSESRTPVEARSANTRRPVGDVGRPERENPPVGEELAVWGGEPADRADFERDL